MFDYLIIGSLSDCHSLSIKEMEVEHLEDEAMTDDAQFNGNGVAKNHVTTSLPQFAASHQNPATGKPQPEVPPMSTGVPQALFAAGKLWQCRWTPLLTDRLVQDENMKSLMMSWYYAGYYTGLQEGQQTAFAAMEIHQRSGKRAGAD